MALGGKYKFRAEIRRRTTSGAPEIPNCDGLVFVGTNPPMRPVSILRPLGQRLAEIPVEMRRIGVDRIRVYIDAQTHRSLFGKARAAYYPSMGFRLGRHVRRFWRRFG